MHINYVSLHCFVYCILPCRAFAWPGINRGGSGYRSDFGYINERVY